LDSAAKKVTVGILRKAGCVRLGRVDVLGGSFEGAESTVVVGEVEVQGGVEA